MSPWVTPRQHSELVRRRTRRKGRGCALPLAATPCRMLRISLDPDSSNRGPTPREAVFPAAPTCCPPPPAKRPAPASRPCAPSPPHRRPTLRARAPGCQGILAHCRQALPCARSAVARWLAHWAHSPKGRGSKNKTPPARTRCRCPPPFPQSREGRPAVPGRQATVARAPWRCHAFQ